MAEGFKRVLALGAASVALAGGAVLSSVGVASAAPVHHPAPVSVHHVGHSRCHEARGYWTRTWHPAYRDRHGYRHAGYWTRTWHKPRLVCVR
ncbi:hypothetical protein ABZ832_20110 [Streptantibioticus parmotrematis]|uniref:hypothetical protein n=1 Tax=Streptantibioticus parmotrematis TaxID=2873249 RepID=UPI0033C8A464